MYMSRSSDDYNQLSETDTSESMYMSRSSDDSYKCHTLRQMKVFTYRWHMTINAFSHILRATTPVVND